MPLDAANIISGGVTIASSAPISTTLSDAWHAVIGDRVATWRLQNAAHLQEKVRRHLEAHNIKLNAEKIPERFAISWFEYATRSDEDEIQEIFAKLLAKANEGECNIQSTYLLEIVSKMAPEDAKVFNFIGRYESGSLADLAKHEWDEDSLFQSLKDGLGDYFVGSIERMISIGLLDHKTSLDLDALSGFIYQEDGSKARADLRAIDSSEILKQTIFFTEAAITLADCIIT